MEINRAAHLWLITWLHVEMLAGRGSICGNRALAENTKNTLMTRSTAIVIKKLLRPDPYARTT